MCWDADHLLVAPSAISEAAENARDAKLTAGRKEGPESQKSVDHDNIFLSFRE